MVHYIALYKLRSEVSPEKLEEMIRTTRSQLLKIPEVLTIHSGKEIDPDAAWPFFLAIDIESMDKLEMCRDDAVYVKFMEEVIKPNTIAALTLNYETEPGKDVKYS